MSGARYRRKVERSTKLTDSEKSNAYAALDKMLHLVECGKVSDFSMVLRGEIRTAHRNSTGLSAGEKKLAENEFHFIKFKRNSALVSMSGMSSLKMSITANTTMLPFPRTL